MYPSHDSFVYLFLPSNTQERVRSRLMCIKTEQERSNDEHVPERQPHVGKRAAHHLEASETSIHIVPIRHLKDTFSWPVLEVPSD